MSKAREKFVTPIFISILIQNLKCLNNIVIRVMSNISLEVCLTKLLSTTSLTPHNICTVTCNVMMSERWKAKCARVIQFLFLSIIYSKYMMMVFIFSILGITACWAKRRFSYFFAYLIFFYRSLCLKMALESYLALRCRLHQFLVF